MHRSPQSGAQEGTYYGVVAVHLGTAAVVDGQAAVAKAVGVVIGQARVGRIVPLSPSPLMESYDFT
jgi:hypothetical protein